MKQSIKRTTLVVTAIGLGSLVRAEAVHQQHLSTDSAGSIAASLRQQATLRNLPGGTIVEPILEFSGLVDTISSASGETNCPAGETWTGTQCSPTQAQPGNNGGQGAVVSNQPQESQPPQSFAPDAENPLASGQPCISVALPIFSGGSKCVDNTQEGGAILVYVKDAVKLLSSAIGGIIVLMIVIAGVQYITSMGNPANVAAAKKRITNAITALIIFLMAFAIINFLLPGGIAG